MSDNLTLQQVKDIGIIALQHPDEFAKIVEHQSELNAIAELVKGYDGDTVFEKVKNALSDIHT